MDFSNIRVVGFDLDKTLYQGTPEIDKIIQRYIAEKIASHMGTSVPEAAALFEERYANGRGPGASVLLKELGLPNPKEIVQEALERADIASALAPDTKLAELLLKLKEKYRSVDLVTGAPRKDTQKKLSALGIAEETFANIITGEKVSKSDGSAYQLWLSKYPKLSPKNFLYIGDRPFSDCEIAQRYGIEALLVGTEEAGVLCPAFTTLFEPIELLLK